MSSGKPQTSHGMSSNTRMRTMVESTENTQKIDYASLVVPDTPTQEPAQETMAEAKTTTGETVEVETSEAKETEVELAKEDTKTVDGTSDKALQKLQQENATIKKQLSELLAK